MERTIKVTGKANISLKPDLTTITLHFNDYDFEYEKVLEKAAKDVNTIKEMLVTLGFEKEDLKTTYFDVTTKYDSYKDKDGNYKSRFMGYKYEQALKFSFDADNKMLGKVLYALAHLETHPKFDINYSVKDTEKAKDMLLEKAIKDAKQKASIMAKAADVTLGNILNIDYSFINVEFNEPVMQDRMMMCASPNNAERYDIDIEPDDIKAGDNVTVIYEIL